MSNNYHCESNCHLCEELCNDFVDIEYEFNSKDMRKDYLNLSRHRNPYNTAPAEYNCGGFALGTYSWYAPYDTSVWHSYNAILFIKIFESDILWDCVEWMLKEIPGLRLIDKENEVKPYEVIVLFRIGNGDYHFVRKVGDIYLHKRGSHHEIEVMDKEEVYSEMWCDQYDSDIIMFALDER